MTKLHVQFKKREKNIVIFRTNCRKNPFEFKKSLEKSIEFKKMSEKSVTLIKMSGKVVNLIKTSAIVVNKKKIPKKYF